MSSPVRTLVKAPGVIQLPDGFQITDVPPKLGHPVTAVPSLGPLAAFVGDWTGSGFNTIFRPHKPGTPTGLPVADITTDNILELNLTSENLSFSNSLGAVPNRGMVQGDVFLNGVPYLQAINDVTNGSPVGIHLEPGIWINVPVTTDPAEGPTVARMASIPHGTTVEAQGTFATISGAPKIPAVSITPIGPSGPVVFPSQTATNAGTPRIPQDLTSFIAAKTITQAMLTDPNSVLRDHISTQKITATTAITISSAPKAPLVGGGTDNIAFLQGTSAPNAQTTQMTATFWIETVQETILVPVFKLGEAPLKIAGQAKGPGQLAPVFSVTPPIAITAPRPITVTFTQIQYSQTVFLKFNGLSWPHVSVATLVPSAAVTVPSTVWT
jgi:hypothetical protein